MRKNSLKILSFLGLMILSLNSQLKADENVLGLDSKALYDIYIGANDAGVWAIKNVEIIGFRQINEVEFLVIRVDYFDAKRSEGLIRYDYVRAVLPSNKSIQVEGSQNIQYR